MADREEGLESGIGIDTPFSSPRSPSLQLEDLVRLLARSAARKAFEASQATKDDVDDDT